MPTYKNNTDSRITGQGTSFDPYDNEAKDNGQEKTSDKILVEEIISVTNIAGVGGDFAVGDVIAGAGGAEGTVLRYDTEDDVLELINRNGTEFGDVKDDDATPPVLGEVIAIDLLGLGEVTANLVSKKVRLTKLEDTPYFNPVVATSISTAADGADETVVIDIDKTEAIIILWHAGEHDISLNITANVVAKITDDNDEYIVETDGEVQSVILTQVGGVNSDATVLQFSSREAAYQYFD